MTQGPSDMRRQRTSHAVTRLPRTNALSRVDRTACVSRERARANLGRLPAFIVGAALGVGMLRIKAHDTFLSEHVDGMRLCTWTIRSIQNLGLVFQKEYCIG